MSNLHAFKIKISQMISGKLKLMILSYEFQISQSTVSLPTHAILYKYLLPSPKNYIKGYLPKPGFQTSYRDVNF